MSGFSNVDGTPLDTLDDIRQSIRDILTTPIGTRVMRRNYGSRIFDLIDTPGNETGVLRVIAASADAIARWENRVSMNAADFSIDRDGKAVITIDAATTADAAPVSLSIALGG